MSSDQKEPETLSALKKSDLMEMPHRVRIHIGLRSTGRVKHLLPDRLSNQVKARSELVLNDLRGGDTPTPSPSLAGQFHDHTKPATLAALAFDALEEAIQATGEDSAGWVVDCIRNSVRAHSVAFQKGPDRGYSTAQHQEQVQHDIPSRPTNAWR